MNLALGLLAVLLAKTQAQTTSQTIVTENQNTGDGNWAATVNYANALEAYSLKFSVAQGRAHAAPLGVVDPGMVRQTSLTHACASSR